MVHRSATISSCNSFLAVRYLARHRSRIDRAFVRSSSSSPQLKPPPSINSFFAATKQSSCASATCKRRRDAAPEWKQRVFPPVDRAVARRLSFRPSRPTPGRSSTPLGKPSARRETSIPCVSPVGATYFELAKTRQGKHHLLRAATEVPVSEVGNEGEKTRRLKCKSRDATQLVMLPKMVVVLPCAVARSTPNRKPRYSSSPPKGPKTLDGTDLPLAPILRTIQFLPILAGCEDRDALKDGGDVKRAIDGRGLAARRRLLLEVGDTFPRWRHTKWLPVPPTTRSLLVRTAAAAPSPERSWSPAAACGRRRRQPRRPLQ